MYLDKVVQSMLQSKKLSSEDLYMLNEAVFNMPDEERVHPRAAKSLLEAIRKAQAQLSGKGGKKDVNFYYDFVGMLSTMQNQQFFTDKQSSEILGMLHEATGTGSGTQANKAANKEVDRLKSENEKLKAEIAKLQSVKEAAQALNAFVMPAYLAKGAGKSSSKKGDGKGKKKEKKERKPKGKGKDKAEGDKAEADKVEAEPKAEAEEK
mmetsp:Transcript_38965/g.70937  ORF Transcript_38965/g.70937 Transcript_38965/m.70937 type:complete len:208 (-) Transcript_38965:81-704(-)